MKASAVLIAAAAVLTACTSGTVINTDQTPQPNPPASAAPVPEFGTANLVNAADYAGEVDGRKGYYFTSPSGRFGCAILPRDKAGCQSAGGLAAGLGIAGEPEEIPDGEGGTTTPNALVVDDDDAGFAALTEPEFFLDTAKVLPFGKALAVAGYRCNVQEETGLSCVRELTGKGFTFTADGFTLQYTDVP